MVNPARSLVHPPVPRAMPSANNTVAVVESQRRGNRHHGGRRSLKGSRPSYAYHRVESPYRLVWRKDTSRVVFIVRLALTASICSLAPDGRTMPSASSTVTVVESQRRDGRRHGRIMLPTPYTRQAHYGWGFLLSEIARRLYTYLLFHTRRVET